MCSATVESSLVPHAARFWFRFVFVAVLLTMSYHTMVEYWCGLGSHSSHSKDISMSCSGSPCVGNTEEVE